MGPRLNSRGIIVSHDPVVGPQTTLQWGRG